MEFSAEISQQIKILSQFGLERLKQNPLRINLVNVADQLLPGMSPKISNGAKENLEDLKVNILNSSKVIEVIKNVPNVTLTRDNQITVTENLQAIGNSSIFAIGDCASIPWVCGPKEGLIVPPRAQAAHQMSDYLIKNLCDILNGKKVKPFIYRDFGSLISLGSHDSVGKLMGFLQGKSLFVEGRIAKFMYLNLYHGHQVKINGFWAALGMLIGRSIQ